MVEVVSRGHRAGGRGRRAGGDSDGAPRPSPTPAAADTGAAWCSPGSRAAREVPLSTDLIINRALTVQRRVRGRRHAPTRGDRDHRVPPLPAGEAAHAHVRSRRHRLAIETLAGERDGETAVHVSVHPSALSSERPAVLIDAHAHLLPRDYPADAPVASRRWSRSTARPPACSSSARCGSRPATCSSTPSGGSRRWMRRASTPRCVTPMPPLLRYDLPAADGLALARHVNEFAAGMSASAPDRMIGLVWCRCRTRMPRPPSSRRSGSWGSRRGDRLQCARQLDRRREVPGFFSRGGTSARPGLRARDAVARWTACRRLRWAPTSSVSRACSRRRP